MLSLGVNLCVGLQSDALLPALRQSGLPDEAYADAELGLRIGCIAISERTSGSDVTHCETVAERVGEEWSLTGHKHYVSNFLSASDCVTFVRTGRRSPVSDFTVFIVPTDTPGLTVTKHSLVGLRCTGTAMVDFENVRVPDECRVGAVGGGLQVLLPLLRRERLCAAVGCTAAAELLLEIAFAYATHRVIQQQPLVRQPVMRHRLADLSTAVDAANAYLRVHLDKAKAERLTSADAARAKLVASQVLWRVADDTMQIVGGRAYTDETAVSRMWRDARVARIGGGTDEVLRELIAGSLRQGKLGARREVQRAVEAATD
jgi:alkylation response protein AidB-like acyl-CoA dehydrogenase